MGRSSLCNSRIGTTFNASKWLTLDPCGLFCVACSYSLHIFAIVTMYTCFISLEQGANNMATKIVYYALYLPCAFLALCNLVKAQHSDPGVVPLGARPLPVVTETTICSPTNSNDDNNDNDNNDDNEQGDEFKDDPNIMISNLNNNNGGRGDSGDSDDNDDNDDNDDEEGKRSLLASIPSEGGNGKNIHSISTKPLSISTATSSIISTTTTTTTTTKRIKTRRRGIRRCRKCNDNYKPPRAHHDSVTGRCVVKFDHFCPWVGNAVGALNHKFFFLFVLYTCIASLLSIVILFIQFIHCGFMVSDDDNDGDDNNHDSTHNNSTTMSSTFLYDSCESTYSMPVLILLIISIAFLVFTCIMLFEQMDAIETNTSKIARMKMRMGHADAHEYSRVSNDFNEFFGGGVDGSNEMALHWFLPTTIQFPFGMKERVLGYEYNQEWHGMIYQEGMDDNEEDIGGGSGGGKEDEGEVNFQTRDLELGQQRKNVEVEMISEMNYNRGTLSSFKEDSFMDTNLNVPMGDGGGNDDVKQRKQVKKD